MGFTIKNYHSAFTFDWKKKFIFNGEFHNFWEIVFIESGKVYSTEEEKIYTLEENQMIFHAPMEFHRIRTAAQNEARGKIITFESVGTLPDTVKNGVFTLTEEEKEDYRYTFFKIYNLFRNDNATDLDILEAESRLKAFIIRISRTKSSEKKHNSPSAKAYNKVASFMADNVSLNLSVDEIARRNFISTSYLKHLFSKYAGISPKKHLAHLQIQVANELLDSGKTVCEVAEALNFSSTNYFSTFYKKQTGKPPLKYILEKQKGYLTN